MNINLKIGFGGYYQLRAHKLDGSSRDVAGWFENIITNNGLERMGLGSYADICLVGGGNSTPVATDTSLNSQVASTSTIPFTVLGAQATPPYYAFTRRTWRFAPGIAAGNLSEVAIGWTGSGGGIFSRALIKDEQDQPTVITILPNEYLDVTYELRAYPPLTDTAPVIKSVENVDTSFVFRASDVNSSIYWSPANQAVNWIAPFGSPAQRVYNGAIGALTSSPAGLSSQRSSILTQPYVANSLTRSFVVTWDLDSANHPGGLSALWFGTSIGTFQASISPPIQKNNLKVLNLGLSISWNRYVP